jgi:hypothetical protein
MLPSIALAEQNNIGTCGWGSKVFEGKKGIAPQVLGATTNGTSGNQTFGISFGTSGCTQDGVVSSTWKTAMFIGSNMNKFARDVSRGGGESVESVAHLLNIPESSRPEFARVLQANFGKLFASEDTTSEQVLASMKDVMSGNAELSPYAASI